MGDVIPFKTNEKIVGALAEDYLRSYRPRTALDTKENLYRLAADLLHAKLADMGLKKINEASPRQLRHLHTWLIDNTKEGFRSQMMIERPVFGRRRADVELNGFGQPIKPDDLPPRIA